MKTDCPHCGKRIRWWHYVGGRPATGERRFLPNRAITVCPLCRADIAPNLHPLEKRLELFVLAPMVITFILFFIAPGRPGLWTVVLGVFVLLMLIACTYMYLKTRNWQRFRRYDGHR
jgi:hypothetical protein